MISSRRRSNPPFAHPVLWPYVLVGTLIILALAATVIWLGLLPPRVVVMSTGAPGSDYEQLAAHYRDILKRSDVEAELAGAGGVAAGDALPRAAEKSRVKAVERS